MQGDSFQFQPEGLTGNFESVNNFPIRVRGVALVAGGLPAQRCDIESGIPIENFFQLLSQLGAILDALVFRKFPQVKVFPGSRVVVPVASFQKRIYGALR